jgi:hypothetical protein
MQTIAFILLGLAALAYARVHPPKLCQPTRFPPFKGWQKLLGLAAIAIALLIVLNPEFLALGLLGDSTFFDLLVVALTLQMHELLRRLFSRSWQALARSLRWLGIPKPEWGHLLTILLPWVGKAAVSLQKTWHRLIS